MKKNPKYKAEHFGQPKRDLLNAKTLIKVKICKKGDTEIITHVQDPLDK